MSKSVRSSTGYRSGKPGNLNYRSGSYGAPYRAPMKTGNSTGRGFMKSPAGRYVGGTRGKGPKTFQPGFYVNSGRDRGSTFIRYNPGPTPTGRRGLQQTPPPRDLTPPPAPAPTPDPPPPTTDAPRRGLRIRESPARRTALGRGRRARGSRRSQRVAKQTLGGLSIGSSNSSRTGVNL